MEDRPGTRHHPPVRIGDHEISPRALSHSVLRTVTHYCYSADRTLARHHVPLLRGLDTPAGPTQLAHQVLPFALKAWADLHNPERGVVRFEHDHYLKMWTLTEPTIEADFLFLDEAQDTNPVLEEVFAAQRGHAQLVMVGDSAQAIYGSRGAGDVMAGFDATPLTLTRSFRFGPPIAEEANRWLTLADAPIHLTGTDTIATEVGNLVRPDAVLCRTNIGATAEVMRLLAAGHRVALTRGGQQLAALALAARDLKDGRHTTHPELVLFPSWGEVQDYAVYDPAGRDLQPFVDLVDTHGPDAILTAVDQLSDEAHADVTVSTAHTVKGREWPTVQIGNDSPQKKTPTSTMSKDAPSPSLSTKPTPASPTSPSLAPAGTSTSAASHGSLPTPPRRVWPRATDTQLSGARAGLMRRRTLLCTDRELVDQSVAGCADSSSLPRTTCTPVHKPVLPVAISACSRKQPRLVMRTIARHNCAAVTATAHMAPGETAHTLDFAYAASSLLAGRSTQEGCEHDVRNHCRNHRVDLTVQRAGGRRP